MNTQGKLVGKVLVVFTLTLIALGTMGCTALGEGAVAIGIEPTPTPQALTYSNDVYGFEFQYPETWSLTEEDHGVVLWQGPLSLRINFRIPSEDIPPYFGRTGMGGGDFIYEGTVNFLGEVIPVQSILYELKFKAVLFQLRDLAIDDLIFMISLEDLYTSYELIDIPEEIREEAKEIVETFKRIEAIGLPTGEVEETSSSETVDGLCSGSYKDFETYVNDDYGFCFRYPSTMNRLEMSNGVQLSFRTMILEVAFRMADENVELVAPGQLIGQFEPLGPFFLFGEEISGFINLIDGKVKEIVFGNPMIEIEAGDLMLYIRLFDAFDEDGFNPNAFNDNLKATIAEILSTFEQSGAE
jgi:hypothetical protein